MNCQKMAIMHKNRKVATINRDGSCTIYFPSFLPYNLYLEESEEMEDRLNNLLNFFAWCSSRVLTLDRKYAKEILNTLGLKQATSDKDRAEIAISYHCTSMMDVYWVKGYREKISFENVNLLNYPLTDVFVDVSLRGRSLTVENRELLKPEDTAPDVGTPGVAPKAWVRRDHSFRLLKDGQPRDVEAEILASHILDCFDVEHVRYEKEEYDGQPVSACSIITSEEWSIVAAEYVQIYAANHDKSLMDLVLEKSPKAYYMMNILDYLVGNTDRHWGNWGVWVDNKTNKIESMYPLMDFNKSFLSYDTLEGAVCLPENGRKTQREAAIEAVNRIGLNQIKAVQREWFSDEKTWNMFQQRLDLLKTYDRIRT